MILKVDLYTGKYGKLKFHEYTYMYYSVTWDSEFVAEEFPDDVCISFTNH